jgi:hypothetical protein
MTDKWLLDHATPAGLEEAIDCDNFSTWTGPEWGTRLKCPICAETYQHIEPRQHIPGRDNYEAGWSGRGDLVILPVWGECEHRWELCFGTHKGETFCFVRVPEQREEAA